MYWNIKEIDAVTLADWLDQSKDPFRVIDVREFAEIAAGTVPGAEPMPLATVPLRTSEIQRDGAVVFICRSGARSAQACAFMQQQGYDNVYNLRGGIMGWSANGLPSVSPG